MSDWQADRARYGVGAWVLQPSYWAVATYRFGRWTLGAPKVIRPLVHMAYFGAYSIVRLATGIEIPRTARIGAGLLIHHFGGVVIHPQAEIGGGCVMRQGVTVGTREDGGACPKLGNNVVLGAYAQVLGDVRVGDGAVIGALTLVLSDVPPGATAVGIPARIVQRRNG